MEKRKRAMAESRMHRQNAQEHPDPQEEDNAVLDNLLERLRNGDTMGRKARRTRPTRPEGRPVVPLIATNGTDDTANVAQDMLAALKANGFGPGLALPSSPTSTAPRRKTRRRTQGLVSEAHSEVASPVAGLPGLPTLSDLAPDSEAALDLTLTSA
jgi:cytokinesis protein